MTIDMNRKNPRPPGHNTVTPGFSVVGAAAVITFLERAFGGKVVDKYESPGGIIFHAEVMLGDSVVMLGETMPETGRPAMPAMMSYYVDTGAECDATYKRALDAGAKSINEPKNELYGYRNATVQDPGGNMWTICAVVEQLTHDEIQQRMASQKH
jgi:PhnB protein